MIGKQSKALFAMVKDIQKDIQDLKQAIRPLQERDSNPSSTTVIGPFIPCRSEDYWYIGYDGGVYTRRNVDHKRDKYKISVRNCFRTKQAAQDYKEYVLMRIELHNLGKELDAKIQKNLNPDSIHEYEPLMFTLALRHDITGTKVVSERLLSSLRHSSTVFIKSRASKFAEVALSKYGYKALFKFLSYQE